MRVKKAVVSPGVYRIVNPATGEVREEVVSPERIQHWADEGNRYLQNGNRLPAPWTHFDPKTGHPIIVSENGILPRSDLNGGYWDKLYTEVDPVEGLTLMAEMEAEGDEHNVNTPAGKIGKTVKEVSIFTLPKWTDGRTNGYSDVPLHIAMVTHPIQPGQKNFEKIPAGALALSMSHRAYSLRPTQMANPPSSTQDSSDPKGFGTAQSKVNPGMGRSQSGDSNPTGNVAGAGVDQAVAALRQCGIDLPDDTNPENFIERLLVAARQKAVSEGNAGGGLYQEPEGAETKQPVPVAMATNPVATAPFDFTQVTKEVLMSHPVVKGLVDQNNQLFDLVTNQAKAGLQGRLMKLISEGKITQKYADEMLKPMLDGFAMANAGKNPIEITLTALEAMPAPAAQQRQQTQYNPSLLLGTAMANLPGAMGDAPLNPYVQSEPLGTTPDGKPRSGTDLINDFFAQSGGSVVY